MQSKRLKVNQNGIQKTNQVTQGEKKKQTEKQKEQRKNKNKMTNLRPNISIIILNVNGLYIPLKKQRLAKWIKEQDSNICCL